MGGGLEQKTVEGGAAELGAIQVTWHDPICTMGCMMRSTMICTWLGPMKEVRWLKRAD